MKKEAEEAAKTWVQFFDEENGYPYWSNNDTGESTYDKPAEVVAAEEAERAAKGELVHAQQKQEDHAADPYASDYDGQAGYGSDYAGAGAEVATATAGGGGDWQELHDEESGWPYWYNSATGESTYENPHGDAGGAGAAGGAAGAEGYGSDYAGAGAEAAVAGRC